MKVIEIARVNSAAAAEIAGKQEKVPATS